MHVSSKDVKLIVDPRGEQLTFRVVEYDEFNFGAGLSKKGRPFSSKKRSGRAQFIFLQSVCAKSSRTIAVEHHSTQIDTELVRYPIALLLLSGSR